MGKVVKTAGQLSSAEVRDCIQRIMTDKACSIMFSQHVVRQMIKEPSKVYEPDAYIQTLRDPKSWKRRARTKNRFINSARQGVDCWDRTYVCKPLENLEPKMSLHILVSLDEVKVLDVFMEMPSEGSNIPVIKRIPLKEAFPDRMLDQLGPGRIALCRTAYAFFWHLRFVELPQVPGLLRDVHSVLNTLAASVYDQCIDWWSSPKGKNTA